MRTGSQETSFQSAAAKTFSCAVNSEVSADPALVWVGTKAVTGKVYFSALFI